MLNTIVNNMEDLFNGNPNVWEDGTSGSFDTGIIHGMMDDPMANAFAFVHELLPGGWLDDAQKHFGLSDSEIVQSVKEASAFFDMDNPLIIHEYRNTGVFTNLPFTGRDDVLVFNREQMQNMGITDKDGFDLVMTHECTHRMLQGDSYQLSPHQEELCCDFMTGVRAGIDNIDISQLENSIQDNNLDQISGRYHIEAIEQGVKFAHEYMAAHDATPSFDDCLDNFNNGSLQNMAELAGMEHDLYIEECNMEHYRQMLENDPDNVTARQQYNESELKYNELRQDCEQKESLIHDNNHIKGTYNPTFGYRDNYYTKAEIETKKQAALKEFHRQQNKIEDISGKINHEAHLKQPSKARLDSLRSDLKAAQRMMEDARSEYNALCYTKSKD